MRTRPKRFLARALFAALLVPASASAQDLGASSGRPLRFVPVGEGAVRIDGSLRDFRDVQMDRVGTSGTSSMRYALGYDANGFYVAAHVDDERLVRRSAAGGRNDDAIVLTVASPGERGEVASEVWIHPGVPGRMAGVVLVGPRGGRPRPARDARVVESGQDGGYDVEAFVPFASIPGAVDWQRGRAAIRLSDVDQETGRVQPTEHASAPSGEPSRMPYVTGTGGELGALASFLRERRVDRSAVTFDLRGDVAGDERPERVVIAAGQAATMGAGYRDGGGYDYQGLGDLVGAGVVSAELRDLTGDRKAELVVTAETRGPAGMRRIATVYTYARGRIEPVWAAVIGVRNRLGAVDGRLEIEPARRGAPRMIVHAGTSNGLGPQNCRIQDRGDAEPLLAPWGPIASQIYQYDGNDFVRVGETPNRDYVPPAAQPTPVTTAPTPATPTRPTPAPTPRAPTMEQLVAAVRRERAIPPATAARFELRANVAEGAEPEELLVLGKTLVVVGPGFRGGSSYFHFDLPVATPDDLLEVTATDVTGDGRAEVLARIRQQLGQGFTREVLVVHRFTPSGFPRVLAVEVMRTDGTRRVENRVRPTGRGATAALVIEPGNATGWNRASWPFAGFANDGVGPLLLPWQDQAKRYRLDGDALVPR